MSRIGKLPVKLPQGGIQESGVGEQAQVQHGFFRHAQLYQRQGCQPADADAQRQQRDRTCPAGGLGGGGGVQQRPKAYHCAEQPQRVE